MIPSYMGDLGKIIYVRLQNNMSYPCLLQPYSLAIKFPVGIPQPAQGWLVLTGQAMVQVHQRVITLHILVQCEFQVPEKRQLLNSLHALPQRGFSSLWASFLCAITEDLHPQQRR